MNPQESPIAPTVGRIVLVRGEAVLPGEAAREVPAIVTRVWSNNCINVHVFNEQTGGKVVTSVSYDGSDEPARYAAWRWMPYQVQKAAEQGTGYVQRASEPTD